jgi:hypothetical protein
MLLGATHMKTTELARKMETTPQNLYFKMQKERFYVHDLQKIAEVTDSDLVIEFHTKDGDVI